MANRRGRRATLYKLQKSDPDAPCLEGTVKDLARMSGLSVSCIYRLTNGEFRAAPGWNIAFLETGKAPDRREVAPKTVRQRKVHTVENPKTGEQIQGTTAELATRFGVLETSVRVFLGGHSKSLGGWILPGQDLPQHIQSEMKIVHLINIQTGAEKSGTRAHLAADLGLSVAGLNAVLHGDAGPWCIDNPAARRVVGTGLRPSGRWATWATFKIRHRDGAIFKGTRQDIIRQGLSPAMLRKILHGDINDGDVWTVESAPTPPRDVRIIRTTLPTHRGDKITWYNLDTGEEAVWTRLEFSAHQDCSRGPIGNHLRGESSHVRGWTAIHIPGQTIDRDAAIARGKAAWRATRHIDYTVYTWFNVATRKRVKATRRDLIRFHGADRGAVDKHMTGLCPIAGEWVAIEGSSQLRKTGKEAIADAEFYQ